MVNAHQNEVGKQSFEVVVREPVDEGCGYAMIHFDNVGMHAMELTVDDDFHYLQDFLLLQHSKLVCCSHLLEKSEVAEWRFAAEYMPFAASVATA